MDSPRALTRNVVVLAALVIAALGISLIPASAVKAEPSLAETERQVDALATKLDATNEKYNTAKAQLDKVKAQQLAMQKQVDTLQKQLDLSQGEVGEIAASAYRNSKIGMWSALMKSGSPQEFVDEMSILEQLSLNQKGSIDVAVENKERLAKAKSTVDAQVNKAASLEKTLRDQKTSLGNDLKKWQNLQKSILARSSRGSSRPSYVPYDGSASGNAAAVVKYALAQQGKPYVFGADGPDSFDCSGLTMAAWRQVGVSLPHSAHLQYAQIPHVSRSNLQPGDLVFFYSDIHHVGIYVGNGNVVHAPTTGDVVKVAPMGYMPFAGAGRP